MPLDAMSDMSDEALLVLFANGDRLAAQALTLRLTPRLLTHAYRLLGNAAEAEDVAQEAMLRLWKIAPNWRQGEAMVTTWLYRVVANLCIDRRRQARASALDAAAEPVDPAKGAVALLQGAERAKALQEALDRLPDRQRQAIVLRHIEDLGNPQIAEIMEISVEAVESLLARGKRALSADLIDRREELGFTDE